MKNFKCCGVQNYKDFNVEKLQWGHVIPEACCVFIEEPGTGMTVLKDKNCPYGPNEDNSYQFQGCFDKVIGSVTEYAIVGAVVVGILQIVGIIFSACGTRMIYQSSRL